MVILLYIHSLVVYRSGAGVAVCSTIPPNALLPLLIIGQTVCGFGWIARFSMGPCVPLAVVFAYSHTKTT